MKRFSLRLTEAEYIKLKSYCDELHVSMNDVVRQLIRDWEPEKQIYSNGSNRQIKHK